MTRRLSFGLCGGRQGLAIFVCFVVTLVAVTRAATPSHRVVVDAGSSGTRVHLFSITSTAATQLWMRERDGVGLATAFELDEAQFAQQGAGGNAAAGSASDDRAAPETVDVDGIGIPASGVAVLDADAQGVPSPRVRAELRPLLDALWSFAEGAVTSKAVHPIPVVVLGTAGFRALPRGRQVRAMQLVGHVVEEELARLAAVNPAAGDVPASGAPTTGHAKEPFMALAGAHVLSDALEGPLAWIAVNVLAKRLSADLQLVPTATGATVTTIDMGGVSLQYCTLLATTNATTANNNDATRLRVAEMAPKADPRLVLYARSFFGLGVNAAITNIAAALDAMPKDNAVLQRIEEHTMASIFQGQFERQQAGAATKSSTTVQQQGRHRQRRGNSRGMLRVPPPHLGASDNGGVDADGPPEIVVMSHLRHVAASMEVFEPGQQDTLRPWGPGRGSELPDGVTAQQYCDNATAVFESVDDAVVRKNRHVIALGYMCTVLVYGLALDRGLTMRAVVQAEQQQHQQQQQRPDEMSWALGAAILMHNGVSPAALATWPAAAADPVVTSNADL